MEKSRLLKDIEVVTFDQEKHFNINSMRKHLRDFLGLSDLTKQFGMPNFKIKMFRLSRSSGKVENYDIVTPATVGNGNAFVYSC